MAGRQPLGASSANSAAARAPFGSPTKFVGAHGTAEDPQERIPISAESVAKNAALVIEALDAESPPAQRTRSASLSADNEQTPHDQARHGAVSTGVAAASGSMQQVDTVLIRRLASDVAADADVVAAWEEVEALRQQLRLKDSELQSALEALSAAQAFGESPGSVARHQETAGQQLARFLKDQLAMRDQELFITQQEAAQLRQQLQQRSQQLETTEEQLGAAQAALAEARREAEALRTQQGELQLELHEARGLAEEQAEAASYARLEAEEARREAAAQVQQLRSELWALEARANLASYSTPDGGATWQQEPAAQGSISGGSRQEQDQGSISLQRPSGTPYYSVGDEVAVDGPMAGSGNDRSAGQDGEGVEEDVFSSPMLSSMRASASPEQLQRKRQPREQQQGDADVRSSFEFARVGSSPRSGSEEGEEGEDAASSGGESEATVSEAAVVARTLTRASALQKDREQLRQQVSDLSQELRDLKGKQKHMAQHLQAAARGEGTGNAGKAGLPGGQARSRQQRAGYAIQAGGDRQLRQQDDAELAERCRLQAVEERHLRSEVELLNRKCDKSNELLLKANHAMKILHYKLQKERKAVARLQEEKCQLQARLLAGGNGIGADGSDGSGADPRHLAALLQELQVGRARIEALLEEKAVLGAKLEAVATGTASREQREAAAAAVAALQQQQEAAAAALREELAAERERVAALTEERAGLEGRLQEALGRLAAAEQISGHLEQMNAYLQEERQRCQALAAQLGREQQGSDSRAAEVARLSALAQQSTEEVMAAREAAQKERSRAEQLLRERAELQGKVEALQETLQRLEKADDVLLRLTEDKAALQVQLRESEADAEKARSEAEAGAKRLAEVEGAAQELRRQLDAALAQHDVAHAAVEGAADQLQQITESHGALEQQLATAGAELECARAELAQRAQHALQLEQRAVALEAELRQVLQQRDAALAQLQELHRQLGAAQQEAAAQHQLARDAQQKQAAAAAGQEQLAARLAELQAENANLKDNLKALEAECEAVRRLGASVDATNQTLVDNMCDMSGLVDAVQALQARNRLLQKDLDTLKGKYAELHRSHEHQARAMHAAQDELAAREQRLSELQVAHAALQEETSSLKAELSSAQAQRDQAAERHSAAEQELGSLRERLATAEASLAQIRQQAETAAQQHREGAAAVTELQKQLSDAQQLVAAGTAERQELERQRSELQQQLGELQRAKSVADGKLVLARQREAQFKEASKQLKVLQQELQSFVGEAQAHQQKQEAAEKRCQTLEARCSELEQSNQSLSARLEAAQADREAASVRQVDLQEQLTAAQVALAQLEAQQETVQSVQQRLSELETEHVSSAEWFDALSSELADKTDQLAALEVKVQAAEEQRAELAEQLADATSKLAAAEEARTAAETVQLASCDALQQARAEAEEKQRHLAEVQEQLEAAEAVAADIGMQLVLAEAARGAAEAALADAQQQAQQAQQQCMQLQQQLAAVEAGGAAIQAEQQERIEHLHHGLFVMAALHQSGMHKLQAADAAAAEQYAAELASERQQHAAALAAAQEQHEAALSEAQDQRQQQVAGLQASVADLSAQLDAAAEAQRSAVARCAELESELAQQVEQAAFLEQQLSQAKAEAAAAASQLESAERRRQDMAADAATHERHAQQLEEQCAVLRQQLAFLHDQQQSDSDECSALKAALAAATAASDDLRGQLTASQDAVQAAQEEQQRLQQALEAAEAASKAAAQHEAELQDQLHAKASEAEAALQAAERARQEVAAAEGQCEGLRQQLEWEEERRRQVERELDSAAEERQQLLAKAQIHNVLEGLSSRLQSQMELLRRIEQAAPGAASGLPAGSDAPPSLEARRELLSQALDKLQALKTENQQLWRMLEEHLSSADGGSGGGGSGRANQYVAHLQAEREELAAQLAAAQQEHADVAARLAAAQAAVAKLQAMVQRLSAASSCAGGGGSGTPFSAWEADLAQQLAPLPTPAGSTPAFEQATLGLQDGAAACSTPQHSGVGGSVGGLSEPEGWRVEKRLLKAVCKLALAVTMDQVGGRQEAASLAADLAPLMSAQAGTLRTLGLHNVWTSLHKLAVAGSSALTPTRGPQQQQQQPAGTAAPAVAPHMQAQGLPQDVWALQQRVKQYKAKCKQLKATVVAMEGAAGRWQSQASEAERGLALLRFRLADLLSEVKWVLEDYSDPNAGGPEAEDGGVSSQQLAELVEQLSKGLRRILRKYRVLAGHLQEAREGGSAWQQHPEQQQGRKHAAATYSGSHRPVSSIDEGLVGAAAPSQGSSWGVGVGRPGEEAHSSGSSGGAGSAHEAMAEAGRKAASIAAKLDQLLTPQSRAAAHGAHTSNVRGSKEGWRSRFAAEAGAAHAADLPAGDEGHPEAEGGHASWPANDFQHHHHQQGQRFDHLLQRQAWLLPPAGDPEEVPLRQRYGSGATRL